MGFRTWYYLSMAEENVIKLHSVEEARRKHQLENNEYIKKYGELLWTVALLTAYQNGGYDELRRNYNEVPMKFINLLLDAYRFKNTELEFAMTKAASRPHLKKGDSQRYVEGLADKLEGRNI